MATMAIVAWAMEPTILGTKPYDFLVNPLKKIWKQLDRKTTLFLSFSENVKLAHIAVVHVLVLVQDEHAFFHSSRTSCGTIFKANTFSLCWRYTLNSHPFHTMIASKNGCFQ